MRVVAQSKAGAAEGIEIIRRQVTTPWEVSLWDVDANPDASDLDLPGCDALVAMWFGQQVTPGMPKLKLLQLPGAGYERIDFDALPPQCTVCNVFEHEHGMAEYMLAAMLEWQIGIQRMDRQLREGRWHAGFVANAPSHRELMGKTIGIIGYGHIGRALAARAKVFGTRVVAVTRTPSTAGDELASVAGIDGLGALCREADFVVVACPLTAATRGLIGATELAQMKETAVVINVARGPVVDEDALFAACADGTIGGAVIDVWYQYPDHVETVQMPSRHAFHELDNVVMTAHASGWTRELVERRWTVIADNLDRLARGQPLRNVVQKGQ